MNLTGIIILIISISAAILFAAYLCFYRIQIKHLKEQLNFIVENDTNKEMTTNTRDKQINDLCISINSLLIKQKSLRRSVETTNRTFKETITNISHDIRTPLTSAKGYVQMLKKDNITDGQKINFLEIVENRIVCVNNLLEQLFEYSKIEAGVFKLDIEKMDINNIARDTISLFYNDFVLKSVQPTINIPETPIWVMVDKEALRRVFENIINNALIHDAREFCMEISQSKDHTKIIFSNRTDAITEADLEHVFERFYTSDYAKTKRTTGLGLSIAKKLIMMMDGEIRAIYKNGYFGIEIDLKTVKI